MCPSPAWWYGPRRWATFIPSTPTCPTCSSASQQVSRVCTEQQKPRGKRDFTRILRSKVKFGVVFFPQSLTILKCYFFFFKARSQRGVKILILIKTSKHKPARQVLICSFPFPPCRYCPGCKTFTFSFCFFKLPRVNKARRRPWSPWTPSLIRWGLGGLFQLHWLCPRPLCASFLSPWRPTEKNSPDNCKHFSLFPLGANPRLILALVFFKIKGLSVWPRCTSQKEAHRNCWLLKYLQLNEAHGVC